MKLLDLFCGAGGAAMGYHRAGFTEIVGIDIAPQPNYPFTFIQGDALNPPVDIAQFDLTHASPPCQHHTRYRNNVPDITDRYEDLIEPTRTLLEAAGVPFVIENVEGAPLDAAVVLCGSMFGLDVRRHRLFETGGGFPFMLSPPCDHKSWTRRFKPSSTRENMRFTIEIGAWDEPLDLQHRCMGYSEVVMELRELSESIPPAYTEYIGTQFLNQHANL